MQDHEDSSLPSVDVELDGCVDRTRRVEGPLVGWYEWLSAIRNEWMTLRNAPWDYMDTITKPSLFIYAEKQRYGWTGEIMIVKLNVHERNPTDTKLLD